MIKPTVGRVVWFYRFSGAGLGHSGPLAAHVAKVHSDRMLNVMVINETGTPFAAPSVPLIQDGEEVPASDYCCWMPYQIGQAAKTEVAEKAIAAGTL
jgi:hypothetical protein